MVVSLTTVSLMYAHRRGALILVLEVFGPGSLLGGDGTDLIGGSVGSAVYAT